MVYRYDSTIRNINATIKKEENIVKYFKLIDQIYYHDYIWKCCIVAS